MIKKQGAAVKFKRKSSRIGFRIRNTKGTSTDAGVENIIACLDKLCLKDKTQTAFETMKTYRRPIDQTVNCKL